MATERPPYPLSHVIFDTWPTVADARLHVRCGDYIIAKDGTAYCVVRAPVGNSNPPDCLAPIVGDAFHDIQLPLFPPELEVSFRNIQ